MKDKIRIELTPSAFALIGANLLPLFGVLWLHWDVYPLVFLYWLENGVIGLFTILRMVFSTSPEPYKALQKSLLTPFFCLHYGGFWIGHGIFVLLAFGHPGYMAIPKPQIAIAAFLDTIRANDLLFAVVGLAASHAYSFVWNFLFKGERNQAFIMELQEAPYSRVIVLHVFIILGGVLMLQLHSPVSGMCALVALKTVVDLWAHSQEHQRKESKRHNYLQRKYARVEKPPDPNCPDSLQQLHPDYSRDVVAEKRYRRQLGQLGCAWLLSIPVALATLAGHNVPITLCAFGLSVGLLIVAIVLNNYPRRTLCCHCQKRMEVVKTGGRFQEVPKYERLTLRHMSGVEQKWLVCHHCKRYFLWLLRTRD